MAADHFYLGWCESANGGLETHTQKKSEFLARRYKVALKTTIFRVEVVANGGRVLL